MSDLLSLPRRQIHLDFHTSEHVTDVGARFDPAAFADTLREAAVDSIVLFAKCHHGWSYYDTTVGHRHPHLSFDLLRAQVEAVRSRGIRYTVYISVGWDERAARENPGWRRILPDGTFDMVRGRNLDPAWAYLCCNTPYRDYLCAQIEEVCAQFPDADGLWLDIIRETECCCTYCRSAMDAQGLDWTSESDRRRFAHGGFLEYMELAVSAARRGGPVRGIFHNSGMVPRGDLSVYRGFSHVEIEALPTGGWGYDHFPLSARYIDPTGLPFMGVTGRFHFTWGELGGLKHPNALFSEVCSMIAHGARVCIGDHLDPSGVLDPDVYRAVGDIYRRIDDLQTLVEDSRPISDVAFVSSIGERRPGTILRDARSCPEDEGALRMLLQGHVLFDVVDRDADLSRYKVVILPDHVRLQGKLLESLSRYVQAGGAVLSSYESGLTQEATGFALDIGAEDAGPSPFSTTYVRASEALSPDYLKGEFSVMSDCRQVVPRNCEVLAELIAPRFERTARHFSGHQHAPPLTDPSGFAAAIRTGRWIQLAHRVFTHYRRMGAVSLKQYVLRALNLLLPAPTVSATNLPSTAVVTVRRRPGARIVQVQYAPREARGDSIRGLLEIIEDLPALADVFLELNLADFRVEEATLAFGEAQMSLARGGARPRLQFEKFRGHVAVVLTGTEVPDAERTAASTAVAGAT